MLNLLSVILGFFAKLFWARPAKTDTKTQQQLEKAQNDEQQARAATEQRTSAVVAAGDDDPSGVLRTVNEAINAANRKL